MKTMRYIWIILGLLSVVVVEAATYGKSYQPQYNHRAVYSQVQMCAEMPIAGMESVNSTTMYSGTSLPLAAATGVSTAGDNPSDRGGGPRRAKKEDYFGDETIDDTGNPTQPGTPIGDAVLPLMLMAIGYVVWKRRRREERYRQMPE